LRSWQQAEVFWEVTRKRGIAAVVLFASMEPGTLVNQTGFVRVGVMLAGKCCVAVGQTILIVFNTQFVNLTASNNSCYGYLFVRR
jgi:hypothetical protein